MSEKENLCGVGIDVSKAKLDIACLYRASATHFQVKNTASGIKELISRLDKLQGTHEQVQIIMESTGRYHSLAALMLSEAGFDVRVINPLLARKHLQSNIRKIKTDKADALVLARMAVTEVNLPKRFTKTRQAIYLRQLQGWIANLEGQRQALTASAKSFQEARETLGIHASEVETALLDSLKLLDKRILGLQDYLEQASIQEPLDVKQHAQLTSIPGISSYLAALLLQQLDTSCGHPKQWIAYLGLDVSVHQSGTWRGRGRLSKRGNPYLRKRFFGAAWGATMHYPDVKAYYQHLKANGRKHKEALMIIARKQLTIAFTVLKNNTTYDPQKAIFKHYLPKTTLSP